MSDWIGRPVIRGFARKSCHLPAGSLAGPSREDWGSQDEAKSRLLVARLAAFHGIVTHSPPSIRNG